MGSGPQTYSQAPLDVVGTVELEGPENDKGLKPTRQQVGSEPLEEPGHFTLSRDIHELVADTQLHPGRAHVYMQRASGVKGEGRLVLHSLGPQLWLRAWPKAAGVPGGASQHSQREVWIQPSERDPMDSGYGKPLPNVDGVLLSVSIVFGKAANARKREDPE